MMQSDAPHPDPKVERLRLEYIQALNALDNAKRNYAGYPGGVQMQQLYLKAAAENYLSALQDYNLRR